jgi:hypothetical protein
MFKTHRITLGSIAEVSRPTRPAAWFGDQLVLGELVDVNREVPLVEPLTCECLTADGTVMACRGGRRTLHAPSEWKDRQTPSVEFRPHL